MKHLRLKFFAGDVSCITKQVIVVAGQDDRNDKQKEKNN
jgi:hypothetical protein